MIGSSQGGKKIVAGIVLASITIGVTLCVGLVSCGGGGGGGDSGSSAGSNPLAASGPVVTPSRTSGIAPLYVMFDTSGTTSSNTSPASDVTAAFHQIRYVWDFGDAGSGSWGDHAPVTGAAGS